MYFEDQKKQGRNRSFAQVENFSNKNKVCQNPTQHQGQAKQIQSTSNKGTQNIQSYNQTHFHQDQPAFSVPSHQQQYPSAATSQNMLMNTKGHTFNHHSSLSLQNNQGVYKYSGSQNSQSSQLNNPQNYQQIQQNPSQSQKSKPQTSDTQNILQEQHINTQQNKPQVQSSNSTLNRAAQLKSTNSALQNTQNMLSANSMNLQNCGNQFSNNQLYCQEMNQHNNVKKSVQVNIKSKQKFENDHLDNSNMPQPSLSSQQTAHSNILPYASNGEYSLQPANSSSSTNQQQLMNQQLATKTKKHQRHHSEIAISKHSKQYSILGVNLQPPPQISIHNYQGFQKESYNKENLNIYDTAISSNRCNIIEQNMIQTKPKTISPHNGDNYKKLDYKNEQITNQNQNQQGQQQYNEKNFNSSSLRFTSNNPSCVMSINVGNASQNNQRIEQGIQKEVINSYMSLRLKNSRQNSISILPTHDQFKHNATEHNQIDDKNNNSSRQYKDTKVITINDENNNNNFRQQNVESLKTKVSPIIQSQKQNDQKLAKFKDQDKHQNISSKTDQQELNNILKGDNIVKNNKFQNYSILADEIQQNLNLQNRRVSALLNNDTPQNYLNLTENQSYQSTNRSLNNKHTSINNKQDQQSSYANVNNISSNSSSFINKSSSTSIHQNNLQPGQLQKEAASAFTNINNGQSSQQNSTTNLSYNHSNNNNQYLINSNQNSIIPPPNNQANPSFQTKVIYNKNDSYNSDNNFQIQSNISLSSKIQNLLSHEIKNNLANQNTTTQFNNPLNSLNSGCQGQSLSSHPTYREKEFNIVQDYNPKSMIEKRRKSHSIANNIINTNSRSSKQTIIQSTLQTQAQELSQNNSHLQSTNSIINQNMSSNSSQIIGYNNQNISQQASNKPNSINQINTQNSHQNQQSNTVLQNLSQMGNNFGLAPSNQPTPTSISPINYMQSQSNYSSNNNLNNGFSSESKQGICNQQLNQNQTNINSGIQDSSKSSVNKVNLTFAEQLKIEKQKKLKEPALNILNLGINSERNSKQNFVSNTANNSYSYCSNNSNNTSAISTPYAITNAADTSQKSNIISNTIANSSNKINKNNQVNEPMIYSGKNSNSSSLQNTYIKNNEFQQSYCKPYDNYTNPNSNRGNLPSNSIHTNQEPYNREMQQINELLQQAKYIAPSNTSNDSKYYTLQYNKLNNFESDFLLPTSAPAQQMNSLAFKDMINQKNNDIPQIIRTNSIISNKKNSPSILDQQNINQLKHTAKPCINSNKQDDYDMIQQSLSINKEKEYSSNSLKGKVQQPQLSGKQLSLNNNNNTSNNNLINQEIVFSVSDHIQQYESNKNLSQNQINKTKNEQISQINIDKNINEIQSQIDKKQQMQNIKSIQQQQQSQQPVKWYLYDSQAQFEEQDNLNNFNSYGIQKQDGKSKDQIYSKPNKVATSENLPIHQQFLTSESSSLTQISTYREENSKCVINSSQLNNFNAEKGKFVNDIQNQEFKYQGQQQSLKLAKDLTIKETNLNQPYQFCQKTTNTKAELGSYTILNNVDEVKDSYLMDFEDLAQYFSQNNGTKPSNNTPQSEKQKQIQPQLKLESDEYKDLCSSIESLRLLNIKDDPFIKIQNQEDFSEIQKLTQKIVVENHFENSITCKNREKVHEDISEAIESDCSLNKYNTQQSHLKEEQYSINTIKHDFYSQSNLNLKQKNLNGFEGLYSIEEGEYELKTKSYGEQESQSSSQFSLKAVEEEELDDEDKSQRFKQSSQNNSQNSIDTDRQSDSKEKANDSEQFKEREEDEDIEDPQLMCEEEQLYEMRNSNISNILDEINNDDPNQAFYTNIYYDQPCFNVESYSNFKSIPQSYSNAPSNQKQDNENNYSQNPVVAPFVDAPQFDQIAHNSQNKHLQEFAKKSLIRDTKENQQENQKKLESKKMENDGKNIQEANQKKGSKSINLLGANHQNQSKEKEENLTKEQKLAILKEQLENFDKIQNQYPIFGGEHLAYLLSREQSYQPNPFYMKDQKQFNPTMRAILLDWMMEVSEEFGLKRETYYIAVNLVDRMFSFKHNLQIKEFQLIGVTSLHIASKLEEIFPKRVEQFILSTDNGYTAQLIFETEKSILQQLNFMVNPPTVSFWGNWFMSQWDIFIQTSEKAQNSKLILKLYESNSCFVQFRQATSQSYELFREYMQIMDFSILDVQTLQIKATQLHCSIMYLVLGKAHGIYTIEDIQNRVAEGFIFTKQTQEFNDIYNEFASVSFGISIQNIIPCIQYISKFFILPVNNSLPFIISEMKEPLQGNYEDFLQYQTHNKNQIEKIKHIFQKVQKING
ncbi:hypothetical protein ABPG74_008905 [Tetrahymena malaccensis]